MKICIIFDQTAYVMLIIFSTKWNDLLLYRNIWECTLRRPNSELFWQYGKQCQPVFRWKSGCWKQNQCGPNLPSVFSNRWLLIKGMTSSRKSFMDSTNKIAQMFIWNSLNVFLNGINNPRINLFWLNTTYFGDIRSTVPLFVKHWIDI